MNICCIYLFLSVNLVATVVAYYRKCYQEFSLCLITNTEDPRDASRNQFIHRPTQSSAVNWCSNHSSTLAIITNETVQSAIEAFIDDSSAKLNSDVVTDGFRFILPKWEWINGNRSNLYPNVYNYQNRYACLEVSRHRTYISWSNLATDRKKFICSYDLPRSTYNNVTCRVGYQQVGIRCYKIRNKVSTWFDARNICIKEEGSDLAILETDNLSITFESRNNTQYWIGLLKEIWAWHLGQSSFAGIIYSNWEDERPSATNSCICLRVATGKWKDCNCSLPHRYVCIQDYASGSTANETSMAKPITATTKLPAGVSSSRFHPIPTPALDDNLWNKTSAGQVNPIESQTFSGLAVAFGIVSSCLVIIIIVVVVVAVIKVRRSRSGGVPNAVHAVDVPRTSAPVRSASGKIPDVNQYEELDLPAIGETSNEIPYEELDLPAIGETSNETPYEELDLAP